MEFERHVGEVVHNIANKVSRPAESWLRTYSEKGICDAVPQDAAVVKAEIRRNPYVGTGGDVIVQDVDGELVVSIPVLHVGDAIAETGDPIELDDITRSRKFDALADV